MEGLPTPRMISEGPYQSGQANCCIIVRTPDQVSVASYSEGSFCSSPLWAQCWQEGKFTSSVFRDQGSFPPGTTGVSLDSCIFTAKGRRGSGTRHVGGLGGQAWEGGHHSHPHSIGRGTVIGSTQLLGGWETVQLSAQEA